MVELRDTKSEYGTLRARGVPIEASLLDVMFAESDGSVARRSNHAVGRLEHHGSRNHLTIVYSSIIRSAKRLCHGYVAQNKNPGRLTETRYHTKVLTSYDRREQRIEKRFPFFHVARGVSMSLT